MAAGNVKHVQAKFYTKQQQSVCWQMHFLLILI